MNLLSVIQDFSQVDGVFGAYCWVRIDCGWVSQQWSLYSLSFYKQPGPELSLKCSLNFCLIFCSKLLGISYIYQENNRKTKNQSLKCCLIFLGSEHNLCSDPWQKNLMMLGQTGKDEKSHANFFFLKNVTLMLETWMKYWRGGRGGITLYGWV